MGVSGIPYVDRTWEVTAGCQPRSDGCRVQQIPAALEPERKVGP